MRLVDALLRHFSQELAFDPYTAFPTGSYVAWPPFFDWLIAGASWLVGLGSPSPHTVDLVGAYFPAVLGALTIIPVFFIGKYLFNRWAGLIAAGVIAVMPGEFLGRSLMGYTDHHIGEILFSTTAILFLVLALRSAGQTNFSLQWSWLMNRRSPLQLSGGLFLGVYLLTWTGGLFIVFLLCAIPSESIVDSLRALHNLGIIDNYFPGCFRNGGNNSPGHELTSLIKYPSYYIVTPATSLLLQGFCTGKITLYYRLAGGYRSVGLLGSISSIISSNFSWRIIQSLFCQRAGASTILGMPPFPLQAIFLSSPGEFYYHLFLSFISLAILIYSLVGETTPV
jgi:hypothetical protein